MSPDSRTENNTIDAREPFITVCRDCDFVDVVRSESQQALAMEEDTRDPARVHYMETGHTVASVGADSIRASKIRDDVEEF
jgi:hypothetical protein